MAEIGAFRPMPRAIAAGRSCPEAALHSFSYSITSSARARIDCGTVRPRAFAVFRLMSSSNFVGCCTGSSAGFARRFCPFEDLVDICRGFSVLRPEIGSIRGKPAGEDDIAKRINARQAVLSRRTYRLLKTQPVDEPDRGIGAGTDRALEGVRVVFGVAHLEDRLQIDL